MRRTIALLKSASSNRWLQRQANDPFVRARADGISAGAPSLRARSGFKLAELAKKYRTLLHGRAVVDLGAAPGGWTQIAAAAVARRGGAVVAVDLLPMEEIKNAYIVQGDFFDAGVQGQVRRYLAGIRTQPSTAAPAPVKKKRGFGLHKDVEEVKGKPELDSTPAPSPAPTPTTTSTPEDAVADTVLSDMMAPMSGVRARDVQASLDLVAAATQFAHEVLRPADPGAVLEDPKRKKKKSVQEEVVLDKPNSADDEQPKLYPGGSLVMKFFLHPDLLAFRKEELDPYFARVMTEKPKASRAQSSEAYWVCLGYKGRLKDVLEDA